MAFTFLSRFRIKADHEDEFVELVGKMTALVDREPGTLDYRFFRLEEKGMFAVFESFVDADADKAHIEADHNRALIERDDRLHGRQLSSRNALRSLGSTPDDFG